MYYVLCISNAGKMHKINIKSESETFDRIYILFSLVSYCSLYVDHVCFYVFTCVYICAYMCIYMCLYICHIYIYICVHKYI